MDDSRTQFASSARQCAEAIQQSVHQRAAGRTGPGMHHHTGGLVHHHEVIVLVQQIDRDFFRRGGERPARQHLDVDNVAEGHTLSTPGQLLPHVHVTRVDQFLDSRAAQLGKVCS